MVGALPDEIYFTSCGTESDNWAILGAVAASALKTDGIPHVVTSALEHPAVTECLKFAQAQVTARWPRCPASILLEWLGPQAHQQLFCL